MKIAMPAIAVTALGLIALGLSYLEPMRFVLALWLPYAAFAVFVIGICLRTLRWARVPVPFSITVTCGQQRSLPWLKGGGIEAPSSAWGVVGRVALEVLLFRSLFRNTAVSLRGKRFLFDDEKVLWLAGLVFHWSMLIVVVRHLRFALQPVPAPIAWLQQIDGFLQLGVPVVYITTIGVVLALVVLTLRRGLVARFRYLSFASDFFPLFLLLGIALTGVLMRHFIRVDLDAVKELVLSLVHFSPTLPTGVGPIFFVHLTLVSTLLAYFPFSKLLHAVGVFLSPTRNQANTSRVRRHVNPWNPPVPTRHYEDWEQEFKDKIVAAGLSLDAPSLDATEGGARTAHD